MIDARGRALVDRVDALSLRERAIVLLTALAVVYLAWDLLILQPLHRDRIVRERMIADTRHAVDQLNHQARLLAAQRGVDPDDVERRIVEDLRAEIARLNQALVEATAHLIPPEEMARVLEAVLTQETELELLRLEGLGAERLVASGESIEGAGQSATSTDSPLAAAAAPSESGAGYPEGLYRHGLRIEFRGSYLETLKYLAALERLDWHFLWDSVHYQVESYPRARVSIVVHSLSFDDAWIRV